MSAENDKVIHTLEIWKKRVFAAFQLIAYTFGVTALLILEFSVVEKALNTERSDHASGAGAETRAGALPQRLPQSPVSVIWPTSPACNGDAATISQPPAEMSPETQFDAAMHELYGRIVRETG